MAVREPIRVPYPAQSRIAAGRVVVESISFSSGRLTAFRAAFTFLSMPHTRNRLVLLGTGTCQLQLHRMASAVLIELEGLRLVFDFGRGIAHRLVELGLRQDDVEHIVLSHFHPDHFSDLVPFLHAAAWSRTDPRKRDLHVYGPAGLERRLDGLLELFGRDALGRPCWALRLHET